MDHPLHRETLRSLEEDFRRSFAICMFVAHLLGKEEVGEATASEKILLRALTPIAKLYTAKKAIQISSEVVEMFGGAGYVEDTGLPRLLRDAQVFSIWEGTTNVLSLDMLRAFEREQALPILMEHFKNCYAAKNAIPSFNEKWTALQTTLGKLSKGSPEDWEVNARKLAFMVADLMTENLLQEYGI